MTNMEKIIIHLNIYKLKKIEIKYYLFGIEQSHEISILVYKYNTCNKLHNRHEKYFRHYIKQKNKMKMNNQ